MEYYRITFLKSVTRCTDDAPSLDIIRIRHDIDYWRQSWGAFKNCDNWWCMIRTSFDMFLVVRNFSDERDDLISDMYTRFHPRKTRPPQQIDLHFEIYDIEHVNGNEIESKRIRISRIVISKIVRDENPNHEDVILQNFKYIGDHVGFERKVWSRVFYAPCFRIIIATNKWKDSSTSKSI